MTSTTFLPKNEEVRFFLRSSNQNVRAIYVLSGLLLISGIFSTFVLSGQHSYYGYGVVIFSLILIVILFSQNLSHKSYYSVGPEVLLLQKGFSRRTIKIKNIVELKIVSEQEAVNELMKFQEEELQTRNNLDTMDSFKAQRRLGKFITYCTAPVSFETIGGNYKVIIKQSVHLPGEFVILKSKTGTQLLLSPKDCKGFIREIEKYRLPKK